MMLTESERDALSEVLYHHGPCAHKRPVFDEFFELGDLLQHCQALRDSATGMGEPLRHPEYLRTYIANRLAKWKAPDDPWDSLVKRMCLYALSTYHHDFPGEPTPPEAV